MTVNTTLFDLIGKVALLTGASKGMGRAMAEGLAEHGARVMLSSRKLDQCQAAATRERLGAYSISKLAVIGLVRNLAAELGPAGVRVNAIYPGLIRTDFAQALWDNPEAERRASEQIPLRRLGEADDLKGLAVFLASSSSSYITGQALTVCGGSHMWS